MSTRRQRPAPVAAEQLKTAHAAADYDKWFRAQVQASIDDPRPNLSAEDARKQMLNQSEELMSPQLYKADAVVLTRVVADKELPFAIKAPNATSRAAIGEASEIIDGRRARFATADALIDNIEKASDQQEGALERMAVNARELGLDY